MVDNLYGEVSVAMPLLNYTTKISAEQTAAEIMSILVKKGATDILTHYGPAGMATGLKWRMETASGSLGFSLPINADAVFEILTRDRVMKTNPAARMQQANRTAWRIIKEWILAQMALIETEMVTVEEVFLPYNAHRQANSVPGPLQWRLEDAPRCRSGCALQRRHRRLTYPVPAGVLPKVEGPGFLKAER